MANNAKNFNLYECYKRAGIFTNRYVELTYLYEVGFMRCV